MFEVLATAQISRTAQPADRPWHAEYDWPDPPVALTTPGDHETRHIIPPSLDTMEPGVVMAAFLSAIDVGRLSGHDRVVVLQAQQRMVSHYTAQMYESMTAVVDIVAEEEEDPDHPEWAEETAASEIRCALTLTRRAADHALNVALDLRRRLPRVQRALEDGTIDSRKALVILRGTDHLSVAVARDVAERVLEDAPRLTTGQLGALVRRVCLEADPDEARDRYQHAVADRRVVAEPTTDGTANLFALDLPPDRLAAGMRRINRLARSLRGGAETRTMDQLRADVLLDLLEGTGAASRSDRGVVDIHVDLATLARLADHPGDLAGYGPIVADIARQVAERQRDTRWRFTATDLDTGATVASGTTRRRPTTSQRHEVLGRTATCAFPGCRMPAAGCDLDHTTPFAAGGATSPDNLTPLCRHDHRLRHRHGWSYERTDATHRWTSPLGHTYTTRNRSP